jgi:HTH-type transcriptional regulator/antitoxin MqsA
MKTCPVCDGSLKREDNFITYKYKNYTKEIMQSGEYCTKCGEAFLSSKDLKASQKEIADFKRGIDHLLTTDEIKAIRKKLNLTQEKASALFGGGIRAFHKYESGENAQSRPLDILLKLMDSGKVSLDDLQRVC